jgi:catalase
VGAYGEFEVTDSLADLTSIDMLSKAGKKTKCLARFSTVGGGKGSADSAHDCSYHHMNGSLGHTYKFTIPDGTLHYIQIHCKTGQGSKTFTNQGTSKTASENPKWRTQHIFESIQKGEYPRWNCYVQVLSLEQAKKIQVLAYDPLDIPRCNLLTTGQDGTSSI